MCAFIGKAIMTNEYMLLFAKHNKCVFSLYFRMKWVSIFEDDSYKTLSIDQVTEIRNRWTQKVDTKGF